MKADRPASELTTASLGPLAESLLLVSCGGKPHRDPNGAPEVHCQIESETDCAELQETFDRGMDTVEQTDIDDPLHDIGRSYADLADWRMKEIGCYG